MVFIVILRFLVLLLGSSNGTVLGTYSAGDSPNGIAVDSLENVWVTNHLAAGTVAMVNNSGALVTLFKAGAFPCGIAVDANGNVWVANNGDGTVTMLQFSAPTGPASSLPSGTIIVIAFGCFVGVLILLVLVHGYRDWDNLVQRAQANKKRRVMNAPVPIAVEVEVAMLVPEQAILEPV